MSEDIDIQDLQKIQDLNATKTLTQTKEGSGQSSTFKKSSGKNSEKHIIKSTEKLQKKWADLQKRIIQTSSEKSEKGEIEKDITSLITDFKTDVEKFYNNALNDDAETPFQDKILVTEKQEGKVHIN